MAKKFLFAALVFSLILSACNVAVTDSNQDSLRNIRLPMGFIPNIQYAPFYVSVERGYFAEAGVEIQFDYSFETDGVALVGAGELPFAVVSGEQVLLARAQEIPVVYVTAWFQDYPVAVVAKEASQIRSAEDLLGRRIGLPGLFGANYVGLRAMLNAVEIAESDVTLDSIGFNQVEALATDQQEIVVGYINNEPLQLRAQGYEVTVLAVADYVQLAANGLISNEDTIANDPELVTAFVAAFLRGLEDAIADPDTAYEISKNYVESLAEADEEVQKKVLALSIDFWQTDRLGASKAPAWENMQSVLLDMGLLSNALDLGSAYTNDFIPGE